MSVSKRCLTVRVDRVKKKGVSRIEKNIFFLLRLILEREKN